MPYWRSSRSSRLWATSTRPARCATTCTSRGSARSPTGEGKASIYTKITQTKDGAIELENFADQPVLLTQVRKVQ